MLLNCLLDYPPNCLLDYLLDYLLDCPPNYLLDYLLDCCFDSCFDCLFGSLADTLLMTKTTLCWSIEGRNYLPVVDVQHHDLTMAEIEIRESQIEHERTKLARSRWLINQRSRLEKGLTKYPDNTKSASKGRNFNALFDTYFTGEEWEIHILRTLRLDVFILLCLLFVPTQFDEIRDNGLQGVFAEEVNRYLLTRSPTLVIYQWAAEKAKFRINSAKSEIDSESPEAKQLLQGLKPYLSQTSRRSGKLSRPPTTTLLSTERSQSTSSETVDTHSTGVNEPQRQWPDKEYAQNQHPPAELHSILVEPQRQWPSKEYAQNQHPPPEPHSLLPQSTGQILPPPSGYGILSSNTSNTNAQFHRIINSDLLPSTSHLSQRAPAAGYNGGHVQNWPVPEQQFSQGLHHAPYSAASMPPPSNNTTHKRKPTVADEDGFVNVSQDGFAQKAQTPHKRTENEEGASKKRRLNPLSQPAVWNNRARSIDSASIWDVRPIGDQTGTFSTAQVSLFSESGQLPPATYPLGNNYSQITNYFPEDLDGWEIVD